MSTKSKFTMIMVLTSLFGAFIFGLLSFLEGRSSLREAAFDELTAIRTARMAQIETYFESVFAEANVITENPLVSEAAEDFSAAFDAIKLDSSLSVDDYEPNLRQYYSKVVLPELMTSLSEGEATYGGYGPKTLPSIYLQNTYIAKNPHDRASRSSFVNSDGQTDYDRVHAKYHEELKFIVEEFKYYDMFLINHLTGDIVYSTHKETDFATNIYNGPYRSSYLGKVVDKVKGDPSQGAVYMSDVEFYLPSNNRPAFFVASGIYENDALKGILAIQLTTDDINSIMTSEGKWAEVGLKQSGETYIVGADYLMRNNSRFAAEDLDGYLEGVRKLNLRSKSIRQIERYKSSLLVQKVKTSAVEDGFAGRSDTRVITNYRGVSVLSAYAPLSVKEHDFVVLAEMDAAEAFKPVNKLMLNTAITTAIVIPLSALVGMWLSSLLMRPTRVMHRTAQAFLDGDETIRFEDQTHNEWGQLASTLNTVLDMAKNRLRETETSRQKIVEMTQRLMPGAIGERYSRGEGRIVSHEENASAVVMLLSRTTLFNDNDDPTRSRDIYEILDDRLDELATSEGVDVLNQAGMRYVAFCGLTSSMRNHAERLFRFVVKARVLIADFNAEHATDIHLTLGFDSGPMFGALIGTYSMAYEIWGDVIESSLDMAQNAAPDTMTISTHAMQQIGVTVKTSPVQIKSLSGEIISAEVISDFPAVKLL